MSTQQLKKDLEAMSVKQLQIFYNDTTGTKNVVFNPKNKRTALVKCLALVDSTLSAKSSKTAVSAKPKKVNSQDKEAKNTVAAFIYERIDAGMSSDDILADLKEAFPESKSTGKDISWLKWKRKQPKKTKAAKEQ
ncbi:MAG: hypothetical protein ACK6DA_01170 [Candidatus Kapaibacterium sp.]